eukprot:719492-Prorocentrum_minimum.AAC.1
MPPAGNPSRVLPIRRRKRGKHGYILTTDQSYAGNAGIFSWRRDTTLVFVTIPGQFGQAKTTDRLSRGVRCVKGYVKGVRDSSNDHRLPSDSHVQASWELAELVWST